MSNFKQFNSVKYNNGQGPYYIPVVIMKNTIVSWEINSATITVTLINGTVYVLNVKPSEFNEWLMTP